MNKEKMFLYLIENDKFFIKYPNTYIQLLKNLGFNQLKKRFDYIKELNKARVENE